MTRILSSLALGASMLFLANCTCPKSACTSCSADASKCNAAHCTSCTKGKCCGKCKTGAAATACKTCSN